MRVGVRWEAVQGCRLVIFWALRDRLNKIIQVWFSAEISAVTLEKITHPRTL